MNIAWSRCVIVIALGGVLFACGIEGPSSYDNTSWTRIGVSIEALYEQGGEATRDGLAVELRAHVHRESTNYSDPIPATVTIAPIGAAAVDVPSSYWEPGVVLTGWEPEYEVHVTVADYGIDLVRRIRTPSFFALGLDPIAVGQPTTMTWSPSAESGVRTAALFQTPWQGSTETTHVLRYGDEPDAGEAEIPATAFPRAATYYVHMTRMTSVEESDDGMHLEIDALLATVATRVAAPP